jgi:CheY-like chemotaxis protein
VDIAVCDDDKLFLKEFQEQLQILPIIENTFLFSDLNAFLFSAEEGRRYDAVLMDIDWDQENNGMDAAEELYKLSPETKVIYVSLQRPLFPTHLFVSREFERILNEACRYGITKSEFAQSRRSRSVFRAAFYCATTIRR